jgi:HAD superfamily hydrolase (TIGR01509 family)
MNEPDAAATADDHLVPMPLAFTPGGAIFDCDGTLADTMPLHYLAWRETLDSVGAPLPVFPESQFYAWGGVTAKEIVERLNAEHGLSLPPEETATKKEETYRRLIPRVQPIADVVAEARRLHAAGVPLAVASGGRRDLVEETLNVIGVRDLFGPVVGSEDVTHGKPAPDPFLLAAGRMGVAPETCVVYEDAAAGLIAARRAGMRAVNILLYVPEARHG